MSKATIKLNKETGLGTLEYNGETYQCGGMPGFNYPKDTTQDTTQDEGKPDHAKVKQEMHLSGEFVDQNGNPFPMPYSVSWIGYKGVFIHEMAQLEGSHGCIHLLPGDAKKFYDSFNGKVRVIFSWI